MRQYSKAREIYKAAQRAAHTKTESLDPFIKGKLANMHADIGGVYVGIGFLESAIDEYKKALYLRPDFVDLRTKLGVTYRDNGEVQDAIRELKEAKKTNPDYAPAITNLGIAYYSQGDIDLARKEWESGVNKKLDNKLAQMYLNLTEKKD
jgi:tetratricopeptide (TPR) repeat protein